MICRELLSWTPAIVNPPDPKKKHVVQPHGIRSLAQGRSDFGESGGGGKRRVSPQKKSRRYVVYLCIYISCVFIRVLKLDHIMISCQFLMMYHMIIHLYRPWFFQVLPLLRVGPEIQLNNKIICWKCHPQKSRNERDGQHYIRMFPKILGTPKSSMLINKFFHYIHHPFFGVPLFLETPISQFRPPLPFHFPQQLPSHHPQSTVALSDFFFWETVGNLWRWAWKVGLPSWRRWREFPWTPWCWTNGTFFMVQHPNGPCRKCRCCYPWAHGLDIPKKNLDISTRWTKQIHLCSSAESRSAQLVKRDGEVVCRCFRKTKTRFCAFYEHLAVLDSWMASEVKKTQKATNTLKIAAFFENLSCRKYLCLIWKKNVFNTHTIHVWYIYIHIFTYTFIGWLW